MSNKKLFPLKDVFIERGKEVITVSVPEHEVRVLQAIHKPMNVRVAGDSDDEGEFSGSAEMEFMRLQRKYQRINEKDPVLLAYPNGALDLERFGFGAGSDGITEAPRAEIRNHKAAAKAKAEADKKEPAKSAK